MHLNNYRLAVLLAVSMQSSSLVAENLKSISTHCQRDERVQFSCRIGAKTVSLCGAGTDGAFLSLAYRYGVIGKIEKEFVAGPDNTLRFFGSVEAIRPKAALEQIWFDQGNIRYLLTSCIGGNCPQHAGLAVIRNSSEILFNKSCARFSDDNLDGFGSDLAFFGSGVETTRSKTELLIIKDVGANDLNKLFPLNGKPLW